jgi:hypothetical protein
MAYTLIAHTQKVNATIGSFTTSPIDTTGADLIVVHVGCQNAVASITDNAGNSYTTAVSYQNPNTSRSTILYAWDVDTHTSHTFQVTVAGNYPTIQVSAYSGSLTTSDPLDQVSGYATTIQQAMQPGAIVPAVANSLFVTGVDAGGNSVPYVIDSGFTILDQAYPDLSGSVTAHAYLVSPDTSSINPTWTMTPQLYYVDACSMACFKPASVIPPSSNSHSSTFLVF